MSILRSPRPPDTPTVNERTHGLYPRSHSRRNNQPLSRKIRDCGLRFDLDSITGTGGYATPYLSSIAYGKSLSSSDNLLAVQANPLLNYLRVSVTPAWGLGLSIPLLCLSNFDMGIGWTKLQLPRFPSVWNFRPILKKSSDHCHSRKA